MVLDDKGAAHKLGRIREHATEAGGFGLGIRPRQHQPYETRRAHTVTERQVSKVLVLADQNARLCHGEGNNLFIR